VAGLVELATPSVDALPGEESEVGVLVSNTGDVDAAYELEVEGAVAHWAFVDPPLVHLAPGDSRTVRLVLRPPRTGEVPAGPMPFTVRLHARADPDADEKVEGTVDLVAFEAFTARLVPEALEVRTRGRARIEVTNDGNIPIVVRMRAESPDADLGLKLDDETMVVPAATSASASLAVRPKHRRLLGKGRSAHYTVHLESLLRVATVSGQAQPKGSLPSVLLRSVLALALLAGLALGGRACLAARDSGPATSKKGLPVVIRNAPPPLKADDEGPTGFEEAPPVTPVSVPEALPSLPVETTVALPPGVGPGVPLRRLFDSALSDYVYTVDANEVAKLVKSGLVEQGTVGRILPAKAAGTVPLYRLKKRDGRHVFTADEAERRSLTRAGAVAERSPGFVFSSPIGGTTALYRLTKDGVPYLTADSAEVQARQAKGWANEGIRGYVLP